MKKTTPASRAPGVPSVGIIRAATASISAACSRVKYSNFGGSANCDECCACRAAARMAGHLAVTHAAETAVVLLNRNFRRENQSCTREPSESRAFNCRFSNKKGQGKEYWAEWTQLLPDCLPYGSNRQTRRPKSSADIPSGLRTLAISAERMSHSHPGDDRRSGHSQNTLVEPER